MPTIRAVTINGSQKRYKVDFGEVDGRRRRVFFRKKGEAEAALRQFDDERRAVGDTWVQLPPKEKAEVSVVLGEMADYGAKLRDVWSFYIEHRASHSGRTVQEVVATFLAAKESSGVSKPYMAQLEFYLSNFVRGREKVDIADIGPTTLDEWFANRDEAPATRQTGMNRLSALFSFCERRGYIRENPVRRVERVRVPHVRPEILTIEQCATLVRAAAAIDKGLLTYIGLTLFCGFRPDEAKRIQGDEIDLNRGLVFLEAEKSKVRNRRIVNLTAPAKRCLEAGIPFSTVNFRRRFNKVRVEAGIDHWPHDVMRKTAASHFYNIYGIEKATEQLGHSAGVLLRVYRELVAIEETESWLALMV